MLSASTVEQELHADYPKVIGETELSVLRLHAKKAAKEEYTARRDLQVAEKAHAANQEQLAALRKQAAGCTEESEDGGNDVSRKRERDDEPVAAASAIPSVAPSSTTAPSAQLPPPASTAAGAGPSGRGRPSAGALSLMKGLLQGSRRDKQRTAELERVRLQRLAMEKKVMEDKHRGDIQRYERLVRESEETLTRAKAQCQQASDTVAELNDVLSKASLQLLEEYASAFSLQAEANGYKVFFRPAVHSEETLMMLTSQIQSVLPEYQRYRDKVDRVLKRIASTTAVASGVPDRSSSSILSFPSERPNALTHQVAEKDQDVEAAVVRPLLQVRQSADWTKSNALMPNGEFHDLELADYHRQQMWTLVLFYPLDFTFVCPTELVQFSDRTKEFSGHGCQIVGVSVDSVFAHSVWSKQKRKDGGLSVSREDDEESSSGLSFPLVSDLSHTLAKSFGVYNSAMGVAQRATFLVDTTGKVRYVAVNDSAVGRSVDECLRVLQGLRYAEAHNGEVLPCGWTPGEPTIRVSAPSDYFEAVA